MVAGLAACLSQAEIEGRTSSLHRELKNQTNVRNGLALVPQPPFQHKDSVLSFSAVLLTPLFLLLAP